MINALHDKRKYDMISPLFMAKWQSGNAAACKAVNAGSIPTLACTYL
tara:strand:- start:376 stop:516 length:141 start_codon:yes stop_codon:yes gene_type:complete